MVIGQAIQEVPAGGRSVNGRSKYESCFTAAVAACGAWVPVTCSTEDDAALLYNAAKQITARTGRYCGLEATKRKAIVYLRMPQAPLGAAMEPATATAASDEALSASPHVGRDDMNERRR